VRVVEGYRDSSYGDGFADVYDEWYHDVSDVEATVADLMALCDGGEVLELGVGTGRLAIPLAATGVAVHGIDSSAAMLDRLAAKDPEHRVTVVCGDMVDDLPERSFSLVFVAYNTLFNVTDAMRQRRLVHEVAARLGSRGRFVVEAFVPDDPPRAGSDVGVRTLEADRVVLSVSRHHPEDQLAEGQFVELSETGGVRLRPWAIRYLTPAQLDDMAADAGLVLEHRWRAFGDHDFVDGSDRHVSVYRAP
jgi:SAM-dependent methyltransferase